MQVSARTDKKCYNFSMFRHLKLAGNSQDGLVKHKHILRSYVEVIKHSSNYFQNCYSLDLKTKVYYQRFLHLG